MGTLSFTTSGFSALPGGTTNTYTTFSDNDMTRILNYAKSTFNDWIQQTYNPSNTPGFTPTNVQIWNSIIHKWIDATIRSENQFSIQPATALPPVVIGP